MTDPYEQISWAISLRFYACGSPSVVDPGGTREITTRVLDPIGANLLFPLERAWRSEIRAEQLGVELLR